MGDRPRASPPARRDAAAPRWMDLRHGGLRQKRARLPPSPAGPTHRANHRRRAPGPASASSSSTSTTGLVGYVTRATNRAISSAVKISSSADRSPDGAQLQGWPRTDAPPAAALREGVTAQERCCRGRWYAFSGPYVSMTISGAICWAIGVHRSTSTLGDSILTIRE